MSRKKQSLLESNDVLSIKLISLPKNTFGANSLKKKLVTRVGEIGNFIVDYDDTERLILIYGKEAQTSHGFKLGFNEDDATAIIHYLKQAKTLFPK